MIVREWRKEEITFEVRVDCWDFFPEFTEQDKQDIMLDRAYKEIEDGHGAEFLEQATLVSAPKYGPIVDGVAIVTLTLRREWLQTPHKEEAR